MKIKYELDGHFCLTKCPYENTMKTDMPKVGSASCTLCKYFKLRNKEEQFIICNHKEEEEK